MAMGSSRGATPSVSSEVKTIFIIGFPEDVKERELHNLLRNFPGYETCNLFFRNRNPMGFALFSHRSLALAARDRLQGFTFDSSKSPAILRIEMAKKNLYAKEMSGKMINMEHTINVYPFFSTTNCFPYQEWFPAPNCSYIHCDQTPAYYSETQYQELILPFQTPHFQNPPFVHSTEEDIQESRNTLFVGNLSPDVDAHELSDLFSRHSGFRQLKIIRKKGKAIAFIHMQDVHAASDVQFQLQGAKLRSSNRGGIIIEFSNKTFSWKQTDPHT